MSSVEGSTSAPAPHESAPASTQPAHAIYDTIQLSEMDFVEEDGMYYYDCPCGDVFEISVAQLAAGEDIAKCPSCSLRIKVLKGPPGGE